MEKYFDESKNIEIVAKEIRVGKDVSFGSNVKIKLNGVFSIGDFSRLGNDTEILGHNVTIGSHLFHSSGLRVGGGGRENHTANLTIGDRCTIHNNFINVCEPILIGDDVGLSTEVAILTHGYWLSVLEGFPASFAGVKIGSGVIIGYRSLIMMGAVIPEKTVIGAQSVVTKTLEKKGIYAGSPARFIKDIKPLTYDQKIAEISRIIEDYKSKSVYRGVNTSQNLTLDYPLLTFKDFTFNVETFEHSGAEDEDTDDFRDYIRKWGIRIYTDRGFKSKPFVVN